MTTPVINVRIYRPGHGNAGLLARAVHGIFLHKPGHDSQLIVAALVTEPGQILEDGKPYMVAAEGMPTIRHTVLDYVEGTVWLFTEIQKTKTE